jgi:hypothetical protein
MRTQIPAFDILIRKFHNNTYHPPLGFTRIKAEDLADHKKKLEPLLREDYPSNIEYQKALSKCWERLCKNLN